MRKSKVGQQAINRKNVTELKERETWNPRGVKTLRFSDGRLKGFVSSPSRRLHAVSPHSSDFICHNFRDEKAPRLNNAAANIGTREFLVPLQIHTYFVIVFTRYDC